MNNNETNNSMSVVNDNDLGNKMVILIPSLEPDERLPRYIQTLVESGFSHVVVVDDGSGEIYQDIFRRIEAINSRVKVLHHDVNHGKGVALKTGYRWIRENLPDIQGIITADADGQHTVSDCLFMTTELRKRQRALILGSRNFMQNNVPSKSRMGNHITSILFFLFYGKWLQDTQTGLRAFRKEDLPFMINIEGDRFEYEMNVLIACAQNNVPMIPISIETIYENDNKGTHYHPIKDSMRIFKVIISGFVKFMGVSILCWLLDQGLFNFFNIFAFNNQTIKAARYIFLATAIARVISASVNYCLNKRCVFKLKGNTGNSLVKYIILALIIMSLSASFVWLFGLAGLDSTIAKLIIDVTLYFISYRIQNKWVFSGRI